MITGTVDKVVSNQTVSVDGVEHPLPPREVRIVRGTWPDWQDATQADLKVGTEVGLCGLPGGTLHTIRILAEPGKAPAKAAAPRGTPSKADLDDMTVEELRDLARVKGVNLHGATHKDDIVKAIKRAG